MAEARSLEMGSYRISLTDKIGQGTFGVVYVGKHVIKGEKVAVKQCEKHGFMAMVEIKNLAQLENHPNIVSLMDFLFSKNSYWIIMEFCDAGNLGEYIKAVNPDIDSKVHIMYECAHAIAFMHSRPNPVIHRDIKPANILMKTEDGKVVVKVTDFGISKVVEDNPDPPTVMLTTAEETPGFMAPEFFLREPYTSSVDVFALGLVYLSLLDYKPGDTALIPLSASQKNQKMIMPVGKEMAQLHTMGRPQPELTTDSSDDTPQIKQVKKLVNSMCVFDRKQRMVMHRVVAELQKLEGGVSTNANIETHASYKIPEIPKQKADIVARPIEEEEWFHGVLPREAVAWLLKEDGEYLVRESKNKKSGDVQYVLSVMWEDLKHFIVQGSRNQWRFEGPTYNSIQELIRDQHMGGEPVTFRSQAILQRAMCWESWQLSNDEIILGRKLGNNQWRFEGPTYNSIQELIRDQHMGGEPVTFRSQAILQRAMCWESWQLSNDEIILGRKLGNGDFSDVFMGNFKGTEVAVKICKETLSEDEKKQFLHEGCILKQYDHPNIVRFIGIAAQRQPIFMVMEYLAGGELLLFLKAEGKKSANKICVKDMLKMCADAAAGMAFLEERSYIHRDLAARNCLVGKDNVVKISHFREVCEEREYINFGTYTSACAVWSFGILVWEVFSFGATPYPTFTVTEARQRVDEASKKKQKMIMPVGMEMAQLHTMGMPQPELTTDSSDDTPQIMQLKKLVNSMVVFDRKQRMVMQKVEGDLQKLGGGVLANANIEAHELFKIPAIPKLQSVEAPPIVQNSDILARPIEAEEWFHGVLPRDAVAWLIKEDGDYLLRESKSKKSGDVQYILSVMCNDLKHFILQRLEDKWRFEGNTFNSIQELIRDQHNSGKPVTLRSQAILKRAILRESWELSNDEILLGSKLGNGYFGDIFMGTFKDTFKVAVKMCKETLSEEHKKKFLHEGWIMKNYDHPNIVGFFGIAAQRQPVMLVMEYLAGGELLLFLRSEGKKSLQKIGAKEMVTMCAGAAAGMAYLEERGCIHRVLAARNCLVGKDNVVKITHFRKACEQREYIAPGSLKQVPIKWTAPEALNFGTYTSACDVWSFGILVWEVFSFGATPYPEFTNNQARERVDEGYRMARPEMAPKEVYDLMLKCWEAEPKDRLTFDEIHAELLRLRKIIS